MPWRSQSYGRMRPVLLVRSPASSAGPSGFLLLTVLSALSSTAAPATPVCFGRRSITQARKASRGIGGHFSPDPRACDRPQAWCAVFVHQRKKNLELKNADE
jgi:hypothetical protein